MSPRNYLCSDTYLHTARYLELHGRLRLASQWPDRLLVLDRHGRVQEGDVERFEEHPDPNQFADHRADVISYELLTAQEEDERAAITAAWFKDEIQRLEALGYDTQADLIRDYVENPRR